MLLVKYLPLRNYSNRNALRPLKMQFAQKTRINLLYFVNHMVNRRNDEGEILKPESLSRYVDQAGLLSLSPSLCVWILFFQLLLQTQQGDIAVCTLLRAFGMRLTGPYAFKIA